MLRTRSATIVLALVVALVCAAMITSSRRGSGGPTVLWTEDTELDKMNMAK